MEHEEISMWQAIAFLVIMAAAIYIYAIITARREKKLKKEKVYQRTTD